ncbi:MAG: hypothetical protein IPL29_12520 [Propionivibrio sp.]|uniref:hypothetical protein n=1 Tax=Propionivibrio sp. TaxID=2212460 RepID=UPI0025F349FA|nr:hypothetical protein [Propionivibrio sp.]MBK7354469.1 hypothetical protein [Propionivibrio sp.]MBK8401838.1 hypothetical protein [Propionivibrio sp.]
MTTNIFIQSHDRPGIIEAALKDAATLGDLHDALVAAGVAIDADTFIFIDEAEEPLHGERHHALPGIKRGTRIYVTRCKRIKAIVRFLDKTEEQEFPPGTRVRAVKAQAVHAFHITPKDAADHVLQLCGSTERPTSDTPLHQLAKGDCAVCFDLVPEKRVEG